MSLNDSCIIFTFVHAGIIPSSMNPYILSTKHCSLLRAKPKLYQCELISTECFVIHKKKVHSEKGPKPIPYYVIPRYLLIAKKDLNLHSKKKSLYSDKGPYYFAHKKLLSNYTDRFRSRENPGI